MSLDKEPATSTLEDVDPIEESAGVIKYREQFFTYIEKPLLQACLNLYDKNILTLTSSANRKDLAAGSVGIVIDYASLSAENKKIAEELGEICTYWENEAVDLIMPVTTLTTVDEIEKKFQEIASRFKKQKPTWAKAYTRDNLIKLWPMCDGAEYEDPAAWKDMGYFYNDQNGLFYESEELIKKINGS